MQGDDSERPVTRRQMIGTGLVAAVLGLAPFGAKAWDSTGPLQNRSWWSRPRSLMVRSLSFRHLHTDEQLNTVYYENGRYIPGALSEVDYLFRDFRTNDIMAIDTNLLDLLYALRLRLETEKPYEIYSAYRSPQTNAMLRREGFGVARNSMHMHGKAIDIGMTGVSPNLIARVAWSMQRGGVGSYSRATFTHVDVGDVRTWHG